MAGFPSRAGVLARWDVGAWRVDQARDVSGNQQPASSPWVDASKGSFVAVCYTRRVTVGPNTTGLARVVSGERSDGRMGEPWSTLARWEP